MSVIVQLREAEVTPENEPFEERANALREALITLFEEARNSGRTVTIRGD